MLSLLALLVPAATAGDQALYERAIQLIDDHYLRQEALSAPRMFTEAGAQLESQIEWLLVEPEPNGLLLRDGPGDWKAEVRLEGDADLPAALARLEDTVRAAGRPLAADLDVRVEILRGVAHTLDRHSVVLHADGLERFDERLSGTLTGIGATISLDEGGLFVRELVPDGPAFRGGLHAGDRVLAVDGVSTVGMVPGDATDRIRGTAGTAVVLTVRRDGAVLDIALRREEITIRNVRASRGPDDVGVLTIEHFSEQTRTYLMEGLAELSAQGLLEHGLVIDLRGNTGGSLLQSAQAADAFVQSGLIVSTVGRNGAPVPSLLPRMEAHADSPGFTMPIAVLMDHSTASGSEILAGALSHLDRALLVGTNSFGKGTVQKVYQLDPDIKLKLTVAEYLLDGGTHVKDVGLQPDLALEEVRFYDGGIWFPEPTRERRLLPAGTAVVPHVDDDDRTLAVAAALVSATTGPERSALLAVTQRMEGSLAAEEERRVIEAFRARGIDWSPESADPTGEPLVDVTWSFTAAPTAGQPTTLSAIVTNHGPPLHRAALRLQSTNPLWDDLVLPVGFLDRGAARTATVRVEPALDSPTRTDHVAVTLESDRRPAQAEPGRDFTVTGAPPPAVAVVARAYPTGNVDELRVGLDVENRGDHPLDAVQARFLFPEVDGIELVDATSSVGSIAAHAAGHLDLRLKVGAAFTERALPLQLRISSSEAPRLVDWKVTIPRDGAAARLEAPSVTIQAPPTVLPVGTTRLHLRATDERALDHLVVFAGPVTMDRSRATPVVETADDKVAWRPGTGRRIDADLVVPVVAGTNRYVVIAEDKTGLRTEREVYVLGDDGKTDASAGPD